VALLLSAFLFYKEMGLILDKSVIDYLPFIPKEF
jgi:hypothetical protein